MATIVRSKKNNDRFVLLGSGFGAYQSKKPHVFFGNWIADTDEGQYAMVCVCNAEGQIGWLDSSAVVVESVDGRAVEALL
jgi:hypothetical protein